MVSVLGVMMRKVLLVVVVSFIFVANVQAKTQFDEIPLPDTSLLTDGYKNQELVLGLKAAIEEDPENYENYFRLAFVYDYMGDYENSLEALKLEVKYLPEDIEAKDVVYGNLARAYLKTGDIEKAKVWIDKSDAINQDNLHNRAHALTYYLHKRDYVNTAKELKRIHEIKTDDRDFYYEAYIFCLDEYERPEDTITLFREVVKTSPDSALAHRALGVAIRNSSMDEFEDNVKPAMEEFKVALELDPEYIPTYISIADIYVILAEIKEDDSYLEDAMRWFNKAYEKDPKNARLGYSMGSIFFGLKDYGKAIEKFKLAYEEGLTSEMVKQGLASAYNNKAYEIYQSGENLGLGLEYINEAIELASISGIILGTKAELLYKLQRYKEAHVYIKQALKLEPGHEEMEQDLALIEGALLNKEGVVELSEKNKKDGAVE